MFIIPGILAILQAILIFLYVPDTPVELVQKEKY
jgi:sugar phosphate permease